MERSRLVRAAVLRLSFASKSAAEGAYPIRLVVGQIATLTKFVEFAAIVKYRPAELAELR